MALDQTKAEQAAAAGSLGRMNFIGRTSLDTAARQEKLQAVLARIQESGIEVVRVGFVDTQGLTRTRPIEARHFAQAARNGVPFTTALFAMDSANNIFQNVFAKDGGFGRETMGGAGDMLAVPDLDTFRILPWASKTASVLSDVYLTDGEACPYDPRMVMRKALAALADKGLSYVGGVEVECHIFRVVDGHTDLTDCTQPPKPPSVAAIRHGYQHLSEAVIDELEPVITPWRRSGGRASWRSRSIPCPTWPRRTR
jgi:glutamine synthetase